MLEAIRNAELGDDVSGEDPTVNRLEQMAAERIGKEAALLVTSGTQANLVSILSNTRHGDSIILEADSHIYWYEVGGLSAIAGVLPLPVRGHMGALNPKDVEAAIRANNIHYADTKLVCIENTHNRAGGTAITPKQIKSVYEVAKAHDLNLYMDGARIFNAAVSLKVDVKELTRHVDNLMFCLSKGLSCPIGSLVVGDEDFIKGARKFRKMLGGGMRQAGVIAAPGIIALDTMINRLEDDHQHAHILAERLAKMSGIHIELQTVQTNIVIFDVEGLETTSDQFISKLKKKGVLAGSMCKYKVRLVTHRGIEREDIKKTVNALEDTVKEVKS